MTCAMSTLTAARSDSGSNDTDFVAGLDGAAGGIVSIALSGINATIAKAS